ncbi:MAG: hypothetical protein JXP34_13965 [Planctomycetes bacterium]|nr:hypothetical protein [Planctomycetota bacterium]
MRRVLLILGLAILGGALVAGLPAVSFARLGPAPGEEPPEEAPGESEVAPPEQGEAPEDEGAKKEEKEVEVEFRTQLGSVSFANGKKAFEEKEWKEAYSKFKMARTYAKNSETRTEVERWIKGIEGGLILENFEARVEHKLIGSTYVEGLKTAPQYALTPAGPLYEEFMKNLRMQAVVQLENFEQDGPYSAKYGKWFVVDPRFVKEGRRSLKWSCRNKDSIALRIKNLSVSDFSVFSHLAFWLCCLPGEAAELDLWVCAETFRVDRADGFKGKIVPARQGWKFFIIDLDKDLRRSGKGDMTKIGFIQFQLPSQKKFTGFFDDIQLIRKDEAQIEKEKKEGKKSAGPTRGGPVRKTP